MSGGRRSWCEETHYFLTNSDSVLTAVLFTSSMKEMGRCELPLGQIVVEENAGKTIRMQLPIVDGAVLTKEPPAPREAGPAGSRPFLTAVDTHMITLPSFNSS